MGKKVGQLEKKKEKVKGRQDFDLAALKKADAKAVNAEGLLTVSPATFNYRTNKPLGKAAFASESVFIKYQSLVATQKSEFFAQKASELSGKADRIEKFGSESSRKAASKLAKAKTQMAKLRAQLIESGMDEKDLDALIEKM